MNRVEQMRNADARQQSASILVYMLLHFAVDFSCFYYLMGTFSLYKYIGVGQAEGFLLYNALAFGLQLPIGRYFEHRKFYVAGVIGVLLVMTGIGLNYVLPMACDNLLVIEYQRIFGIPFKEWKMIILVILAVGNAFFHVAGGIDSLYYGNGNSRRCGLFVSTGALGVSMGSYAGQNLIINELPILCVLILGLIAVASSGNARVAFCEAEQKEKGHGIEDNRKKDAILFPIACLLAILLRSYIGPFQRGTLSVLFLAAACTAFGKAIGGILADEFGRKLVGTVALIVSTICFFKMGSHTIFRIIGLVSFNIAMPITLYGLYLYFPNHPGVVFGLNSFALLIGYVMYSGGVTIGSNTVIVGSVLAACCIAVGIPGKQKAASIKERGIGGSE